MAFILFFIVNRFPQIHFKYNAKEGVVLPKWQALFQARNYLIAIFG